MDSSMNIIQGGFIQSSTSKSEQDKDALEAKKLERNNFFIAHKDEQWFKNKYHPDDSRIQKEKRTIALKKRLDIFNEFLANGKIDSVSVDAKNRSLLVHLLDSIIIKLEGGKNVGLTMFNATGTSIIQQEPEHEKKEINKKTNAGENSNGVVDINKKDETNKIDKSDVNSTEEAIDLDAHNPEIFKVWKGRIWSVNGITNHFQVVRNDMKLCASIINAFDNRSGLLQSIEGEHPAMEKTYGVVFSNPGEATAEEKELLDESVPFESEVDTEMHIQLLKALDRMILYLRIVHSVDFYNYTEYAYEDDISTGSSIMHVRCPQIRYPPTQQEITDYCHSSQTKADCLIALIKEPSKKESILRGAIDVERTMDDCVKDCMHKVSHKNWLCKVSGKTFKRRRDLRKNLFKDYSHILDYVKKDLIYFNNFVRDPNRPKQIPHSYPAANCYQMYGSDFM